MRTSLTPADPLLFDLSESQRQFVVRVLPLAQRIQQITHEKAEEFGVDSAAGILASVAAADMIVQSNWGEHPLSHPMYDKRIFGNNLNLSESNEWWNKDRSSVLTQGIEYKCYESQEEFANNQTDEYVSDARFLPALATSDFRKQLQVLQQIKRRETWNNDCELVINHFKLREFDSDGESTWQETPSDCYLEAVCV